MNTPLNKYGESPFINFMQRLSEISKNWPKFNNINMKIHNTSKLKE